MSDVIAEEPHFIAERDGHILTVTLNRPAAKNAFSPTMLVGVADAWKMLNDDDELRVGILTRQFHERLGPTGELLQIPVAREQISRRLPALDAHVGLGVLIKPRVFIHSVGSR